MNYGHWSYNHYKDEELIRLALDKIDKTPLEAELLKRFCSALDELRGIANSISKGVMYE